MRGHRIETDVDNRPPAALSDKQGLKQRVRPSRSNDDFGLVKIASNWKRRDKGLPEWWRDHLMGIFR